MLRVGRVAPAVLPDVCLSVRLLRREAPPPEADGRGVLPPPRRDGPRVPGVRGVVDPLPAGRGVVELRAVPPGEADRVLGGGVREPTSADVDESPGPGPRETLIRVASVGVRAPGRELGLFTPSPRTPLLPAGLPPGRLGVCGLALEEVAVVPPLRPGPAVGPLGDAAGAEGRRPRPADRASRRPEHPPRPETPFLVLEPPPGPTSRSRGRGREVVPLARRRGPAVGPLGEGRRAPRRAGDVVRGPPGRPGPLEGVGGPRGPVRGLREPRVLKGSLRERSICAQTEVVEGRLEEVAPAAPSESFRCGVRVVGRVLESPGRRESEPPPVGGPRLPPGPVAL